MNTLNNIYAKSLAENAKQSKFWGDYLNQLRELHFNSFSEKLKVPALVPIGSRIMFRGDLIHTNEVTVALGADYFVKCSIKQAEVLRQHRILGAETKLKSLQKERDYLENQVNFMHQDNQGFDIVEHHTEEEDNAWREQHRENMKKYKQSKKHNPNYENTVNDEDLWNRLEELELQEELENEYFNNQDDNANTSEVNLLRMSRSISEEQSHNMKLNTTSCDNKPSTDNENEVSKHLKDKVNEQFRIENNINNDVSDILYKAINKQKELEIKLLELKNKNRGYTSKSESELMSRLDELEELDELEDEIDRLDDILYEETEVPENETSKNRNKIKRSVSFADDEDDSETLEIEFKHSDVEPNKEPYDPEKGIMKPSDIYEAYSNLHMKKDETVSILKKTKYPRTELNNDKHNDVSNTSDYSEGSSSSDKQTIVLKDITEKVTQNENKQEGSRPPSLFKMKRMQRNK